MLENVRGLASARLSLYRGEVLKRLHDMGCEELRMAWWVRQKPMSDRRVLRQGKEHAHDRKRN